MRVPPPPRKTGNSRQKEQKSQKQIEEQSVEIREKNSHNFESNSDSYIISGDKNSGKIADLATGIGKKREQERKEKQLEAGFIRKDNLTSLTDRLRERKRVGRRRALTRLAIAGVSLGLILLTVWIFFFSSVFGIQKVEVAGANQFIDTNKVTNQVLEHRGESLLRISLSKVEKSIEDGQDAIAKAEISRSWPHTIKVSLTPATPVAYVVQSVGVALLDAEGKAIGSVPVGDPLLAGKPKVTLTEGKSNSKEAIAAAVGAMKVLPQGIIAQVLEFKVNNEFSISFILQSGATVVWGNNDLAEIKAKVLELLLSQPARVYDVSTPRSPSTR